MRIKVTDILKDYAGNDLSQEEKPLDYRTVFVVAMNNAAPGEIFTAEDKAKIYGLSVKLYASDEVDLTIDDMAFIKKRVSVIWSPLVYGKVNELFETRN